MKRHSEAVARNSAPIADVLAKELPDVGLVLEIASGTGEHAVFFARRFSHLRWQPSDADRDALSSIEAWRADAPANLLPTITIDARSSDWRIEQADAILCINMIHISEWAATEGLFSGAARILSAGGPLILYGPFLEAGIATAPSNLAFDRSLRERDGCWGLRDVKAADDLAERLGLARTARYPMPANNLMLVYRSAGS